MCTKENFGEEGANVIHMLHIMFHHLFRNLDITRFLI